MGRIQSDTGRNRIGYSRRAGPSDELVHGHAARADLCRPLGKDAEAPAPYEQAWTSLSKNRSKGF